MSTAIPSVENQRMPADPTSLPGELLELAPAIEIRMQRSGPMRPPGIPMELPISWVEVSFDPESSALPDSVRTRLAATLGNTSVVRILESSERSQKANMDRALAQLKERL